jgi:hypothetical protein
LAAESAHRVMTRARHFAVVLGRVEGPGSASNFHASSGAKSDIGPILDWFGEFCGLQRRLRLPAQGIWRMIGSLGRKLRVFWQLSVSAKLLLVPAWLSLCLSAGIFRFLRFGRLGQLLGRNIGAGACCPLASPAAQDRATAISSAVRIASRYTPFRGDCVPQALAGQFLCRALNVPSALHFGIRNSVGSPAGLKDMEAHAWLVVGPVFVTGGRSFRTHTTTACFLAL